MTRQIFSLLFVYDYVNSQTEVFSDCVHLNGCNFAFLLKPNKKIGFSKNLKRYILQHATFNSSSAQCVYFNFTMIHFFGNWAQYFTYLGKLENLLIRVFSCLTLNKGLNILGF